MAEDITQDTYTFEDAQGRSWDVSMNMAAARRVDQSDFSELTDVDFSILNPSKELFTTILGDTPLLFGIIWAVVQPQVEKNLGVNPKEDPEGAEALFLESIDGPTVKRGRDVMWRALAGFFPEHRTALLTLVERLDKANARIGERIRLMEGDLDEILENRIDQEMDRMKETLTTEAGPLPTSPGGRSSG